MPNEKAWNFNIYIENLSCVSFVWKIHLRENKHSPLIPCSKSRVFEPFFHLLLSFRSTNLPISTLHLMNPMLTESNYYYRRSQALYLVGAYDLEDHLVSLKLKVMIVWVLLKSQICWMLVGQICKCETSADVWCTFQHYFIV